MSNFSDWTIAKLDERFNLTQVDTLPTLTTWLKSTADISPSEQELLTDLRHTLTDNVLHWNEQELSLHFIGPFLRTVDFTQRKFNIFAERYLVGTVDGETLSGYPDGLIASGWREPKVPYFCLQEYKPQKNPQGDPVGQCLAAMLVAQELNQNQHPIYGCYILGRDWFFMVLQGRQYAISEVYAATKEDIFDIFRILKGLKAIILTWIAEEVIMSNFGKWTLIKLDKRFRLEQVKSLPVLENWLASPDDLSENEQIMLHFLKKRSTHRVDNWNEQEYALNIIGPILSMVDFMTEESDFFAERALMGIVDGEELNGIPDGMVAKGRREPEIPYFCLQKWYTYPPFIPPESGGTEGGNGDPAGQCLAAMLVAQELNKNQHPVYGCYTLGRNWFFMALQGHEYAISNSYTVTRDDIFDIFRILRGLRAMIAEWIAQDTSS